MVDQSPEPDSWNQRQQAQAAAFDQIGTRYDEVFPHKDGQRDLVTQLLTRLPAAARVLDLGCGTGLPTAHQLTTAGCEVTGVDLSPVMIEQARRNVPGATFKILDASALDPDLDPELGAFDAAVAFFSLLMLPRDRIVRTLARVRRSVVPGGWLALGMVEADLDDVELPFLDRPVRLTGWPRDELRQVVHDAGFAVELEDARTYEPVDARAPAEVQLFLLARRNA
jgi:SAM-dependent methyltransferase